MEAVGKGKRTRARDRGADDNAVSSVLGAILMLAVLMTLVPGMILLRGAISAEMDAQREAAERAAWCARNPAIGPPTCEDDGPMPGYDCREVEAGAWLCAAPRRSIGPTQGGPTPPTVSPLPIATAPTTPTDPLP